MTESSRLGGLVAVVTGAGSGQGRAVARAFAIAGAGVLVNDINASAAGETVDMIEATHGRAVAAPGDVSVLDDAVGIAALARERFGRLDVLYNNAGINPSGSGDGGVVDLDLATWDRVMTVDVKSVAIMSRVSIPMMLDGDGGSIVNVSSVSAVRGGAAHAYTAAKGAVISLTRALATTYGPRIRANVICPGAIRTPMTDEVLADPALRQRWVSRSLVERIGEADDIAPLAVYLASPESSFVTGTTIVVDGGYSAH
jgi:NAD(P)-dependent dehydrogenase (short-subunit alcohol dehydrogenase family)